MGTFQFSLTEHLGEIAMAYPRRYRCHAATIQEYEDWAYQFRKALMDFTGIKATKFTLISDTLVHRMGHPGYIEEKHAIQTDESVSIPMYLLIPHREGPYQSVLVFHGHDPSVQYCLGSISNSEDAEKNQELHNNYAQVLAEAGYLVCVVVQRGLDERITSQVDEETGRSCRHLAVSYLKYGKTLLGERIRDGMLAIDYLKSRKDTIGKLGCTGHSAGGATALWLAALDLRIDISVISGYFSSFADSIFAMRHCECNYVPGAGAGYEMGDVAALLAPRPVCFVNGQTDDLFPLGAAKEQYKTVRHAYGLFGKESNCDLVVHPGGHQYEKESALSWFKTWMNKE